jgi:hypothetical protein
LNKVFSIVAALLFVLWVLAVGFHFIIGPLFSVLLAVSIIFLMIWLVQIVRMENKTQKKTDSYTKKNKAISR